MYVVKDATEALLIFVGLVCCCEETGLGADCDNKGADKDDEIGGVVCDLLKKKE